LKRGALLGGKAVIPQKERSPLWVDQKTGGRGGVGFFVGGKEGFDLGSKTIGPWKNVKETAKGYVTH